MSALPVDGFRRRAARSLAAGVQEDLVGCLGREAERRVMRRELAIVLCVNMLAEMAE